MSRLDPNQLNVILERCLSKLQAGQDLESILSEYPGYQDSLRPVLESMRSVWVARGSDTVPLAAMARSRARLMKAVYEARQTPPVPWWQRSLGLFRQSLLPTATLLVCFSLLFTGIASAQALPGQALYPVKRAAEKIVLSLPASPSAQLAREESFDERRQGEVYALITQKSHEEVAVTGFLTRSASAWSVEGVDIFVDADLATQAAELEGHFVSVEGDLLASGQLQAESIEERVYTIAGRVQTLESSRMQVEDIWIQMGAETQVDGLLEIGRRADVSVIRLPSDVYLAVRISSEGIGRAGSPSLGEKTATATAHPRPTEKQEEFKSPTEPRPNATEDEHEPVKPDPTSTRRPTSTPEPEHEQEPSATARPLEQPHAPTATATPKSGDHEDEHKTTPTPEHHEDSDPTRTPTRKSSD